MLNWKNVKSDIAKEEFYYTAHPTGLAIYVYPKPGYQSSFAMFGTNYGSIDTSFELDGVTTEVPAGIAHYLEHKLFESEHGDAFELFAKTGASANAYTSFDHTAYLFSCTDNVYDSLEILLDFVQSPYFTQQGVDKERGIISQEIEMMNDSPERKVYLNLLEALYVKHPVRIDIAGSVDSVSKITPELLQGCYDTFYNLNNMVLSVAGNITPSEVEKVADKMLKVSDSHSLKRVYYDEPTHVTNSEIKLNMPVSAPLFYLGYKQDMNKTQLGPANKVSAEWRIAAQIICDIIAGESSPLFSNLMDKGLINQSFESGFTEGPGYMSFLFGGESSNPQAVISQLKEEITQYKKTGISKQDFQRAKTSLYGRMIFGLNSVYNCASILMNDHFSGNQPFSIFDVTANIDLDTVNVVLDNSFDEKSSAVSLILPIEK